MINKKRMKIKALLLCSLALGFLSASAVERGYLSYQHVGGAYDPEIGAHPTTYDVEILTLGEGDSIRFLSTNKNISITVEVTLPDESC